MAVKKKQHYVPKFYLKYFSADEKRLNIVNLKSKKIIILGGLKEQCYKNYFYGKDLEIENLLSEMEAISSKVLLKIKNKKTIPKINSKNYTILLYFMAIQISRTLASSRGWKEMFSNLNKSVGEVIVQLKDDPVLLSMSMSSNTFPLYSDMGFKLIINKTDEEFILSDNPVVEYNQLFEDRYFASNTGVQSKGLQLFLPISEEVMLLAYDKWAYKVGNKNSDNIVVIKKSDIVNINLIQLINAEKNIYFTNSLSKKSLDNYLEKLKTYKRKSLNTIKNIKFVKEANLDRSESEVLHMKKTDIKTNFHIDGILIKKKARIWKKKYDKKKNQETALLRTPALYEKLQHFNYLVESSVMPQESIINYFRLSPCPELNGLIRALQ